mmetsp:Transcript_83655/g.231864  ORF Transcript_83655/g.231864 Transcript_83655/m.231864 type:complete len:246 (-) Transcript_83655:80-817(-)
MAIPEAGKCCRHSLECPICLELLCDPLALPCGQAFCRKCVSHALVPEGPRRCPLCRGDVAADFNPALAPVDQPLREVLLRTCTVEYTERVCELALEAARLIRLRIMNDCELVTIVPRPKFRWTLRVKLEPQDDCALPSEAALPEIIEKVRFGLLPVCRLIGYGGSETEEGATTPSYVEISGGLQEPTDEGSSASDEGGEGRGLALGRPPRRRGWRWPLLRRGLVLAGVSARWFKSYHRRARPFAA